MQLVECIWHNLSRSSYNITPKSSSLKYLDFITIIDENLRKNSIPKLYCNLLANEEKFKALIEESGKYVLYAHTAEQIDFQYQ